MLWSKARIVHWAGSDVLIRYLPVLHAQYPVALCWNNKIDHVWCIDGKISRAKRANQEDMIDIMSWGQGKDIKACYSQGSPLMLNLLLCPRSSLLHTHTHTRCIHRLVSISLYGNRSGTYTQVRCSICTLYFVCNLRVWHNVGIAQSEFQSGLFPTMYRFLESQDWTISTTTHPRVSSIAEYTRSEIHQE